MTKMFLNIVFALLSGLICIQQIGCFPNEVVFANGNRYDVSKNGIHNISGHDYYINNEIMMNWIQAAEYCNILGMKLITLESEEKNTEIISYLQENNELNMSVMWTSGHRVNDTWFWTGIGQVFTYTNWYETQPNHPGTDDPCLHTHQYEWADINCSNSYYPFMCEY